MEPFSVKNVGSLIYSDYIKVKKLKIKVMRKSIAFSSKHLDHKKIAQRLFDELNVQEFGFASVCKELMKMGIELEDVNKIIDEIKKLVK